MNKLPIVQLIAVTIAVIYFAIASNTVFATVYGGLISLINTWLLTWYIKIQANNVAMNAVNIVGMMALNVVMRIFFVAIFTLIGLFLLRLAADALIIGFVCGQVGFLIDRVRQK